MIGRSRAFGLGLLLVAAALAACSSDREPSKESAARPTAAYGTTYADSLPPEAALVDPSGACRSAVPAGTVLAPTLRAEQVVGAAIVCGYVDQGDGVARLVTRQARGAALADLTAALHLTPASSDSICDASGRSVPVFAVQLQDQRWVNPEIPSDGCHPRAQVLTALRKVLEQA